MKLKQIVFICITLVCIVATVVLLGYNNNNNYVLKINDEKITKEEFEVYLEYFKRSMEVVLGADFDWNKLDETEGVPYIDILKADTKSEIVSTKVQLQEAKKRNIVLTEEEKSNVELLISSNSELITTFDNLTLDDLIKLYEEYFLIEKLAVEVVKENQHYDARHILFSTEGLNETQKEVVKATAQSVLDRIKNGEEMSTLAMEYSQDPGSQANGGLYTTIGIGSFVSEFETAALSLQDGDLYPELVESPYGYHIIKLEKLNSEVTGLTDSLYQEFAIKAQEWIKSAKVEEGGQYYLIGVDSKSDNSKEENALPDESVEVQPDEVQSDKE